MDNEIAENNPENNTRLKVKSRQETKARDSIGKPNKGYEDSDFPIVGIGASAGGLEAFTQLITALPDNTGMAFVLIQHLSPTHASSLADILSSKTKMPVNEVENNPKVQPNNVYVIPPGMDMDISGGILKLTPRIEEQKNLPIDRFFKSLAEYKGHKAIGIVLSGAVNDGTLGVEAIKSAGGITFAQDATAQTGSMPLSAINSGHVDFVMPPEKIAHELVRISRNPFLMEEIKSQEHIKKDINPIIQLLNDITGVDFTYYKVNTLYRRITRRMLLHKIEMLDEYIKFLKENPAEIDALYQDILINVTNFFRNPKIFEALKTKVFPRLLKDHKPGGPLRVWTLACSTGEEAYSIAIAFTEYAESVNSHVQLQIFATDLNNICIEKARAGIYPKNISDDVSKERLKRFFVEADGGYRIKKSIRDLCVFSKHNILADPSFSRMDLISCRNLLIYLESSLQQQIMSALHYALNPGGTLWLGNSETIGCYHNLFEVQDIRNKFYGKKAGTAALVQTFARHSELKKSDFVFTSLRPQDSNTDLYKQADRILLKRYAPASVLISPDMEIIQFRGDTSPYLTPAPGKASLNLLKMLREGLLVALRSAVTRAGKERIPVRERGLKIKSDGGYREIAIEVIPIKNTNLNSDGFLIIFEEVSQHPSLPNEQKPKGKRDNTIPLSFEANVATQQIVRLTQELQDTREYLQSVIDQQELANEELQTAHEEVQSTNEELQSINEELETSKEEIQASNEELATTNDEMNNRNQEMNRVNNDIVNLLGSIQLSIIMLDANLCIRRFTPWAEKMLNLLPSDVGRPFGNIKLNFTLFDIEPLLMEVLNGDIIREVDIQSKQGHWYSLRIRPYKTAENKIDGVVIMLIDVDTLKRAFEYTESIVATVREPLVVLDANMRIRTTSSSFLETFKLLPEEAINHVLFDIDEGQWNIPELRRALKEILPRDDFFDDFEIECQFKKIGKRTLVFSARRLLQHENSIPAILVAIEDVTDKRQLERILQQRSDDLIAADIRKNEFLAILAHELRAPLAPLGNALQLFSMPDVSEEVMVGSREIMNRQLKQMVRLVDDLMDISRITSGKVELRLEYITLTDVIKAAVETIDPVIKERKHALSIDLGNEPIMLHADTIRLAQVFGNLLNNAAKYTNVGGNIEVKAWQEDDQAVIAIRDNGIGIEADMIPKIFDIFVQINESSAQTKGSIGIGLSLVKNLVALHNGTIEAYSEGLGKGSIFTVHLPLVKALKKPRFSKEITSTKSDSTNLLHRILVIDDNIASAKTMSWLLEFSGHEVRYAYDGKDAINIAKSFSPDVVLLDIGLPVMNGYEICKTMKAEPLLKNTIFIAQTGWGQEEHKRLSKEAGFDYHLVKPLDIQELNTILQSI